MRRFLLKLAAGVSAVLCAAACVLWVRSYSAYDSVSRIRSMREIQAESWRGELVATGIDGRNDPQSVPDSFELSTSSAPPNPTFDPLAGARWRFAGFAYQPPETMLAVHTGVKFTWWMVAIPYWSVATLLAIGPILVLRSGALRRARQRRSPGLCPACGYDLRATPDRCPECGATAPAKPKAAA